MLMFALVSNTLGLWSRAFGTETTILGRVKLTNCFATLFEHMEGNFMARFKHESYAYALEKSHVTMKTIYMYGGLLRVCKTHVQNDYMEVSFDCLENAEEWDAVSEQIASVHFQIPWLLRDFSRAWYPIVSDDLRKRVYKRR